MKSCEFSEIVKSCKFGEIRLICFDRFPINNSIQPPHIPASELSARSHSRLFRKPPIQQSPQRA